MFNIIIFIAKYHAIHFSWLNTRIIISSYNDGHFHDIFRLCIFVLICAIYMKPHVLVCRFDHRCCHDVIKWNIFRVTGPLCGEFTGYWWIPLKKAVTCSFDVFFDLCLNKRLSKQSWGCWFERPSRSLWRHCNDTNYRKEWVISSVCGRKGSGEIHHHSGGWHIALAIWFYTNISKS